MRHTWLRLSGAKSVACSLAGALILLAVRANGAAPASRWDHPAAELASRVAEVLGPASAHFELRNLSSIPAAETNLIQRLLEEDLKADGVTPAGPESANSVRVTLSQNTRGGLWVAEIAEGNETKVVMETVDQAPEKSTPSPQKITLHRQVVAAGSELPWKAEDGAHPVSPILAAAQVNNGLVVLTPDRIAIFLHSSAGWIEGGGTELGANHPRSRDPRGAIIANDDGSSFSAYTSGVACSGAAAQQAAPESGNTWTVHCYASDDPWPVMQTSPDIWTNGFYNAERDFFTGVVIPAWNVDLPAFYTAGFLPGRPAEPAMVLIAADGRVMLGESGQLKPVAGTRDWGSDLAVVSAGCGAGAQILVSSSGEGANDSLRAYELPAQEAVAVSDPLALGGAVMTLWPAQDGKSALAIVRTAIAESHAFDYEVDRVTESCN